MSHLKTLSMLAVISLSAFAGSASAAAQCISLSGGNTTASPVSNCTGCTSTFPQRSIDGDPNTSANIVVPLTVQGANGIRATAQRGIVFPAGSRPGAILEVRMLSSAAVNPKGTLRTYLNGKPQDAVDFYQGGVVFNGVGSISGLKSLKATKPFNAVEVVFDGAYNGYTIDLFEFCSDSKKK